MTEFTPEWIAHKRWAVEVDLKADAIYDSDAETIIKCLDEISRLQSRIAELECQLKSKQIVIESKEQTIREFAKKMLDLRKR